MCPVEFKLYTSQEVPLVVVGIDTKSNHSQIAILISSDGYWMTSQDYDDITSGQSGRDPLNLSFTFLLLLLLLF